MFSCLMSADLPATDIYRFICVFTKAIALKPIKILWLIPDCVYRYEKMNSGFDLKKMNLVLLSGFMRSHLVQIIDPSCFVYDPVRYQISAQISTKATHGMGL